MKCNHKVFLAAGFALLLAAQGATATDFVVGAIDTIGGTTYDWQLGGPPYRMICNSPDYGIHVLWMYSASTQANFPDRNMRYNFYDYAASAWNWIDPDYMQSGLNVFTGRVGYGNIDADPSTGVAVVSCHAGVPIHPDVARDLAPGAGTFEYCTGLPVMDAYLWPFISVGQNSTIHCVCIDDASRNMIHYSRIADWCNWDSARGMAAPQPDPDFPCHNIAASDVSHKVVLTWTFSGGSPDPGFYRESFDGGTTWEFPTELPWPPAYGGDTATSFHITSLFPYYDRQDRLHIVTGVMPYVGGHGFILPADIWHWCPDNTPNWVRIHRAECDPAHLQAQVGYNAIYACRPTIGEDSRGRLHVAWEQFDSSNVEPGPPPLLRADIFYSHDNSDNGQTWVPGVKITERNTTSHRFPCIIDYLSGDTVYIAYMIDLHAGFFVQGGGPVTNNPIVVHKLPLMGIEEAPGAMLRSLELSARPNPFSHHTSLDYALPGPCRVKLEIYDMAGRRVGQLVNRFQVAGRYSVNWHRANLCPGVYVACLRANGRTLTEKLTIVN